MTTEFQHICTCVKQVVINNALGVSEDDTLETLQQIGYDEEDAFAIKELSVVFSHAALDVREGKTVEQAVEDVKDYVDCFDDNQLKVLIDAAEKGICEAESAVDDDSDDPTLSAFCKQFGFPVEAVKQGVDQSRMILNLFESGISINQIVEKLKKEHHFSRQDADECTKTVSILYDTIKMIKSGDSLQNTGKRIKGLPAVWGVLFIILIKEKCPQLNPAEMNSLLQQLVS